MVRQNPDDIDPDPYADERDLTELPEIPLVRPEPAYSHADLRIPVPEILQEHVIEVDPPDTPEEMAKREGIHKRIQA